MNILKIKSDIISVIRANVKSFFIRMLNRGRYSCDSFVRMQSNVNIVIDTSSIIWISRGVLISSNSVISAIGGGKLTLGAKVGVNRNSMIMCHESITIGDNTIMGPGVCIYDHDHVFDSTNGVERNEYISSTITIGSNCWIGAGTIILRGTTIGNNCLIGAGCVVKGNYPDGSVVIQKREETIKQKNQRLV